MQGEIPRPSRRTRDDSAAGGDGKQNLYEPDESRINDTFKRRAPWCILPLPGRSVPSIPWRQSAIDVSSRQRFEGVDHEG